MCRVRGAHRSGVEGLCSVCVFCAQIHELLWEITVLLDASMHLRFAC
jgi:hypothetical protein